MSATDTLENSALLLLLNNTNFANFGDATGLRGSTAAGNVYVSLHTADPGEAGNQSTSEATYTGYARVAVARTAGGWTISGTAPTKAANAAAVSFPTCTAGSSTVTYFGIGGQASGAVATDFYLSGPLTSSLAVTTNVTPNFAIGALQVTLD